jgi:hypothetical protein
MVVTDIERSKSFFRQAIEFLEANNRDDKHYAGPLDNPVRAYDEIEIELDDFLNEEMDSGECLRCLVRVAAMAAQAAEDMGLMEEQK